jgi:transcriptional regulator with XRE-family HTH domain
MPAKPPQISATASAKLQALGTLLRAHRKRLGVSATMAAESAGMSRVTWYRIEQGNPAVTIGAYLQALTVLGLDLELLQAGSDKSSPQHHKAGWIPVHIKLADYPQLQQLAWHVRGTDAFALSPREALDIYERHGRHLNKAEMSAQERELFVALQEALGSTHGI